jgi:hypothetical protein
MIRIDKIESTILTVSSASFLVLRGKGDIQTTVLTSRAFMSIKSVSFPAQRMDTFIVKKMGEGDIPVST